MAELVSSVDSGKPRTQGGESTPLVLDKLFLSAGGAENAEATTTEGERDAAGALEEEEEVTLVLSTSSTPTSMPHGGNTATPRAPAEYWGDGSGDHGLEVRDVGYLTDGKKMAGGKPLFRLLHVDAFELPGSGQASISSSGSSSSSSSGSSSSTGGGEEERSRPFDNLTKEGKCAERVAALRQSVGEDALIFVVSISVAGTPPVKLVWYFGMDMEEVARAPNDPALKLVRTFAIVPEPVAVKAAVGVSPEAAGDGAGAAAAAAAGPACAPSRSPGGKLRGKFLSLSPRGKRRLAADAAAQASAEAGGGGAARGVLPASDFRNQRFKLVTRIREGPFLVKKLVRTVPVLLGQRVEQKYFCSPDGLLVEVSVDPSVSPMADKIVSCCRGYSRNIDCEVGIIIEGTAAEELPERLVGVVQMSWFDLEDPMMRTPLY